MLVFLINHEVLKGPRKSHTSPCNHKAKKHLWIPTNSTVFLEKKNSTMCVNMEIRVMRGAPESSV